MMMMMMMMMMIHHHHHHHHYLLSCPLAIDRWQLLKAAPLPFYIIVSRNIASLNLRDDTGIQRRQTTPYLRDRLSFLKSPRKIVIGEID